MWEIKFLRTWLISILFKKFLKIFIEILIFLEIFNFDKNHDNEKNSIIYSVDLEPCRPGVQYFFRLKPLSGEWSLWRPFKLPYSDLFLNFSTRMALNKLQ